MGPKPPKELSAFCRGEWKIWVHCTFWTVLFTFSLMFSLSIYFSMRGKLAHTYLCLHKKEIGQWNLQKKKNYIISTRKNLSKKYHLYLCIPIRYLCINNDGFLFNRFNKVLPNKNELIQTRKFQNTPSVTLSPTSTVNVPICTSYLPP